MMRNVRTDRRCLPSIALAMLVAASSNGGCTASRPGASPVLFGGATPWVSPIAQDHPLVGRVYDVERARTVDAKELLRAARRADVLLLGEQHDNADHHRLQAHILSDLVADGRRPAVAFEQIDFEYQDRVDAALAESGGDPAARVAEAAKWSKSGWPPFEQYRPVFDAAIRGGLPIRAANLSRTALRSVFAIERAEGVPTQGAALLAEVPLEGPGRLALERDIEESHCGYANERMTASMVEAQRRRDVAMAVAIQVGDGRASHGGVVLIAGFGHVRNDYGVPLYLPELMPGRSVVSVAFVEVIDEARRPADYAAAMHADALPFDYVVFTPRADDNDPCEEFRQSLEKMKNRGQAPN